MLFDNNESAFLSLVSTDNTTSRTDSSIRIKNPVNICMVKSDDIMKFANTCIAVWLHPPGNHPGSHLTVILNVLTIIPQLLYLTSLITLICYIAVLRSCHFVITCITPFEVKFIDFIQRLSYFLIMVGSAFLSCHICSTVVWEKFHIKNFLLLVRHNKN